MRRPIGLVRSVRAPATAIVVESTGFDRDREPLHQRHGFLSCSARLRYICQDPSVTVGARREPVLCFRPLKYVTVNGIKSVLSCHHEPGLRNDRPFPGVSGLVLQRVTASIDIDEKGGL